jgi:hypothetical protein
VPGGWVSNALVHYAEPGTELILGPALGTMYLSLAGQRDLLFVAGGTGLSPVKAIIEQALRESSACPGRSSCSAAPGPVTGFTTCPSCTGWRMPTRGSRSRP